MLCFLRRCWFTPSPDGIIICNTMATKKQKTIEWADQYKHPLWQKKRLEILERDEWCCSECGEKDNELQVHHKYYKANTMIWDYPDDAYESLCIDCHEEKTVLLRYIKDKVSNLSGFEIRRMVAILHYTQVKYPCGFDIIGRLCENLSNAEILLDGNNNFINDYPPEIKKYMIKEWEDGKDG